jgi:hypothetical protein
VKVESQIHPGKRSVQHRWRGAHGIPTLARGNEKKEVLVSYN